MDMQGDPSTMQQAPDYENLLAEVKAYFVQQIERCEAAGITKDHLLLDPDFGFGKTLKHNYQLQARLGDFHYFGLLLRWGCRAT